MGIDMNKNSSTMIYVLTSNGIIYFLIHYQKYINELNCGIIHLHVHLQVDQSIELGNLVSTNQKETSFRILLLNCCKEAIVFLEHAFHFYGWQ
jgi:hypothetical protein